MALYITSLNSGSNGNCYYVGNDTEAVLIDAGISCRETEKRMGQLGLSMQKLKAIFISHEHIDHIKGLSVLASKYSLPVFITNTTLSNGGIRLEKQFSKDFFAFEPVQVGQLTITAFPKHHDAGDPHSFIISSNGITIGVFTDIGICCENVSKHFSLCHAAFLESNYDDDMLHNGRYPIYLKNRIRGGKGHLSNKQALEIFTRHKPPFMSHLFLSHLSRDNNDPQLVQQLFDECAGNTRIVIASRYAATPVYTILADLNHTAVKAPVIRVKAMQLNLFETI